MNGSEADDITRLLDEIRQSPDQFERLIPLMLDDMKRIGHNQRASAGHMAGPTLQTTALVNEAFLKLHGRLQDPIENRTHFRRLIGQVMRQLIVDYARRQMTEKRGGLIAHDELGDDIPAPDEDLSFTLALESAMSRLEKSSQRTAEIMAASLYAGFTAPEMCAIFDLSERTVRRELARGRAWLVMELEDDFQP
jgi:RNA polymerase sigma factor (TIGR02999 family)